jgi:hypothetical protein
MPPRRSYFAGFIAAGAPGCIAQTCALVPSTVIVQPHTGHTSVMGAE